MTSLLPACVPPCREGVQEGVYGLRSPGPSHRTGVLSHVSEGELPDHQVTVGPHRHSHVVALRRPTLGVTPHNLVTAHVVLE